MDLKIATFDVDFATVVTVSGDIDVYSAPLLRDTIDRLMGAGRMHIVMDLQEVDFMDSTALGVLVGRLKALRHYHGSLTIVCDVPRSLRIFGITGLDKVLPICSSLREAGVAHGADREFAFAMEA